MLPSEIGRQQAGATLGLTAVKCTVRPLLTALVLVGLLPAPAVAAPPWSQPVPLGPARGPAVEASLAFASNRAALAAWTSLEGSPPRALTRVATGLDGPSRALGGALAAPAVAYGPNRFALLRSGVVRDRLRLYASSVFPPGHLGAVRELTCDLVAGEAALAANARGDVAAAWLEQPRGELLTLRVAYRARGGRFGPARSVLRAREVQGVAVALGARGDVVLAYRRRTGRAWGVEARAGQVGRGLGRADALGPGAGADDVAVAVERGGRAVVAWGAQAAREEAAGVFRGVARSYAGARFRRQAEFPAGKRGHAMGAHLAVGPRGQRALVWVRREAGQDRVLVAFAAPLGRFGPAEQVSGPESAAGPSVAFDPASGRPSVVWLRGLAPAASAAEVLAATRAQRP